MFSASANQRSTLNAQRPTLNSEETMRRYSQRQNLSSLSEINITPLLDLAFVLLIIFMITTPLLENSVGLIIPSSAENSLAINASQVQTISIARDESVRLNNQPVDLELLTDRLIEMKRANPELAVVIRPDRDLAVQKLIDLMDWLRRAEIAKVGIATRIEPK
jgi:biopolymer transport protein ExbD